MNEAIKLAIEKGGYDLPHPTEYYGETEFVWFVQDPLFWQALGKALGWRQTQERFWCDTEGCQDYHKSDWLQMNFCSYCGAKLTAFEYDLGVWQENATQYFETHITGGDTSAFWKELLK